MIHKGPSCYRSHFRDAKKDCEYHNMTLMTPSLQEMNEIMMKLNVSLFWTGYTRVNQSHFHEIHRDWYASCDGSEWTSPTDKGPTIIQPGIALQWFA